MDSAGKHVSLWRDLELTGRKFPPLGWDAGFDVVVIGAGITGLTTALLLKRGGLRVGVLESFDVGAGATGHTTCHLTSVIDTDYDTLLSRFGKDNAILVRESAEAAIAQVESLVGELGIDCGFRRLPGYHYTESPRDVKPNRSPS